MSKKPSSQHDLLTILAITIVAWLVWTTVHEVFGHATACIIAGGRPLAVTTSALDCDTVGVSSMGLRMVYAAGSAANLLVAITAGLLMRSSSRRSASEQYFLWLTFAFHALHAGTLLVDGPFGKNDWAGFLIDLQPAARWNLSIAIVGLFIATIAMLILRRTLGQRVASLSDTLALTALPLGIILILNASGIWISRFDMGSGLLFGAPRQIWWLLIFPVAHLGANASTSLGKWLPWLALAMGSVLLMRLGVLRLEASSVAWVFSAAFMFSARQSSQSKIIRPLKRDDFWLMAGAFSLVVYLMLGRGMGSVGGVQLF